MIKLELEPWEESDIKTRIVEKVSNTIISREFKLYGDISDEGCYTPYDKFKNYVANLVADRIFKYMIDNPEIRKRIDTAISKAEKSIVATAVKNRKQVNRMRLIDADRLKEAIHTDFSEHYTLYHDTDQTALFDMVMDDIDEIPTAFDKEKVKEELENYLFEKYCVEGDEKIDEIIEKGGIE